MNGELIVDEKRVLPIDGNNTGIFVRAKRGETWGSYDIAELTRDSLLAWLRENDVRGERTILFLLFLLGHGLTSEEPS